MKKERDGIVFFASVEEVILAGGLDFMMYADGSQLHIAINPSSDRSSWQSKILLCIGFLPASVATEPRRQK